MANSPTGNVDRTTMGRTIVDFLEQEGQLESFYAPIAAVKNGDTPPRNQCGLYWGQDGHLVVPQKVLEFIGAGSSGTTPT